MHHQATLQEMRGAFAHVDGGDFVRAGEGAPVVVGKALNVMPGEQADRRIAPAFGQGLANAGDSGRGGRDARHHVIRQVRGLNRFDLFV